MTSNFTNKPIPIKAGVGLRSAHYRKVLDESPTIPWFEVHSENFFAEGGLSLYILDKVRERYPLSFHGVGLSLGTAGKLDKKHLLKLKTLIDRFNPHLVSEHISWSNAGGTTLNDLLPLPYTKESLSYLTDNIKHVQDTLGRQILIENPSTYLEFKESEVREWEFINKTIEKGECALLLDVNNIYVSCTNSNSDTNEYIANIPFDKVKEIHLAGYEEKLIKDTTILIDTHSEKVSPDVWNLYKKVIRKTGAVPTLIEWDNNIPELSTLIEEMNKAQEILNKSEVKNAAA